MIKFASIPSAINDIKKGKVVIVLDDEGRENEGDFICAAEKATPKIINFMAKYGRGLICAPMLEKDLNRLNISAMVPDNSDRLETAFTVSVDAKQGTSTGISAYDRASTIKKLVDNSALPRDFTRPGHIFPLTAKPNGVLERAGHTEAAVDLARYAGLKPAGVICEIMKDNGMMARRDDCFQIARKFKLKVVTIADLIKYRHKREKMVELVAEARLPLKYGKFKVYGFKSRLDNKEHIALVYGNIKNKTIPVRIHSQCLTGDVFGSLRCDCGDQLGFALKKIAENKAGALVYLCQEGRGIGLLNKLCAYSLQDKGLDTVEANEALGFKADLREYGVGAHILSYLGVKRIRLMTNNPKKLIGLSGYGIKVVSRIPIEIECDENNKFYLSCKKEKLGHMLKLIEKEDKKT